jgi:hypothetical protein
MTGNVLQFEIFTATNAPGTRLHKYLSVSVTPRAAGGK